MIPAAPLDLRGQSRAVMPRVPEKEHLAEAAVATWRGRMINEYGSSRVFAELADQLAEAGFSAEEVKACREFAEEERTHGVLCGAVVEALGGEALAELPELHAFPRHTDVAPIEGVLRNLLSVSCMSETVAVALIGAERLEMPEGELRDLLTRIWADEIGHARFGWGIVAREVPKLDEAAKRRLGAYLAVAFAHVEEHELAHLPVSSTPPADGVELGLCSGADARQLFFDTIQSVVIPRLNDLGLPASLAWRARHETRGSSSAAA